ncbi:hypothetical protein [Lysinibacillus sphaericus]|uniref:hypothetical protein n=1 Tax=Lysinibacillus sphaericus TaxID=1421 RepID=UPI00163C902D|nr:hypothetical protein [Lysinibacillus sp. SDF0037]
MKAILRYFSADVQTSVEIGQNLWHFIFAADATLSLVGLKLPADSGRNDIAIH